MAVYLSALWGAGAQLFTSQGVVLAGGTINTYIAGTTTPQITYTDHTGSVSNGTQILLDSAGRPTSGVEIWLPAGVSVKFIVLNSVGVQVGGTYDYISGINDPSGGAPANAEWVTGTTPSYISATQFSVTTDQRALYPIGQRVRYTVSGGTGYGTVTAVAFGAVTTVTVQTDSIPLDSGLSVVAYGLLNAAAPSVSAQGIAYSSTASDTTVPSVGNALKRMDRAIALTTSTGGTTAFILTPAVPLAAYATNAPLLVKFNATSTGSPTMNVSGLGVLNLKQINSAGSKVAAAFTAGQIAQIIYDGTDLVVMLQTAGGRYLRTVVVTANGTYNKGTDANLLEVEGVGGGGGAYASAQAGGGGAGGYFRKTISSPAASYTLGIGTAGSAAGGNGGNTTFDVLCTGLGGTGTTSDKGGAGGTATGGDINFSGGPGCAGSANGGANLTPGSGGNSYFGGGAASGGDNVVAGTAALANSGGGGSGGSGSGGAGGTGIIVIKEYS